MVKFEKFIMWCYICEADTSTISWFVNGLHLDIICEVLLCPQSSIEEAYNKALDIEEYFFSFSSHLTPSYLTIPHFSQPTHGSTLVDSPRIRWSRVMRLVESSLGNRGSSRSHSFSLYISNTFIFDCSSLQ